MGAESIVKLTMVGNDQGAAAAAGGVAQSLLGLPDMLGAMASPAGLAAGGLVAVAAGLGAVAGVACGADQEMDTAMRQFAASTGTAVDELEPFEEIATRIFTNNWGQNFEDISAVMADVNQIMGATGTELENVSTNAIVMRDVFEKDVGESVDAAKVLMDNFGLSSTEAFDLMASGIQNGLDRNGDFLDTIREYGNLFGEAGFTADEFYSALETGAAGGVLGTDKIADAFKEANIRIQELSDDTLESLEIAGADVDGIFNGLQDGSMTVADALQNEILPAILSLENPIHQNTLGVKVFGTQWEDLGADAFAALDLTASSLADMEGATATAADAVSGGLGPAWSEFKRTVTVAVMPLGDIIASGLEGATPVLSDLGAWLGEKIPAAIETTQQFFADNWPIVASEIQAVWEIVEPIFGPMLEWLEEKAPVALEALRAFWVDVAWPAIQQSVVAAWEGFKDDLELMVELFTVTIPGALDTMSGWFSDTWATIQQVTETAYGVVDSVFQGVQKFAEWLSGQVFEFKFSIPELPEWMQTQSPMKLHTAFMEFDQFLKDNPISPRVDPAAAGLVAADPFDGRANVVAAGPSKVIHIGKIEVNDPAAGRALLAYLEALDTAQAVQI